MDQRDGFFELGFGDRDVARNIYFKAAKLPPGSGRFVWFIYRCNPQGKDCVMLSETQIGTTVRVTHRTGEVFISAVQNDEIVFRRLAQTR